MQVRTELHGCIENEPPFMTMAVAPTYQVILELTIKVFVQEMHVVQCPIYKMRKAEADARARMFGGP